ncbi:MAG: MerR family transcriptional regulator [Pontixanthobacter sp.]
MAAEFDDGKDDGALRTIGEVSRAVGIKTHVLRYWEQQFPMLEPLKRSGNRRYYRPSDVALIERINTLVNVRGFTLKGALQDIEDSGTEGIAEPVDAGVSAATSAEGLTPAVAPLVDPGNSASPTETRAGSLFSSKSQVPLAASDNSAAAGSDDTLLSRSDLRDQLQRMRDRLAAAIAA